MSTTETKNKENTMQIKKGSYDYWRIISDLRIVGMYTDSDKFEKTGSTNGLSFEAEKIVKEAME